MSVINQFKKNHSFATLCMLLLGIGYLLFGALSFSFTEQENEERNKLELIALEQEFKSNFSINDRQYSQLKSIILNLEQHRNGVQWSFTGSLYFAITVVTAIGYGHSVPQTRNGKLFCIAYTVIGIPLWFVTFQMLADGLNLTAARGMKNVLKKFGSRKAQVTKLHLRLFGLFSCFFTIVIGLFSFANFEKWSYLESAYYCLMTLTTIGFGDYVALQENGALEQNHAYILFSFVYIIGGLIVFAATLNLFIIRPGSSSKSSDKEVPDEEISNDVEEPLKDVKVTSDNLTKLEDSSFPKSDARSKIKCFLFKVQDFARKCFPDCLRNAFNTKSYDMNDNVKQNESEVNNNYYPTEKYEDLTRNKAAFSNPTKFDESFDELSNIPSRFTKIEYDDEYGSDVSSEASYSTDTTACPSPEMPRRTVGNDSQTDRELPEQDITEETKEARESALLTSCKVEQLQQTLKAIDVEMGGSRLLETCEENKVHIENELPKPARAIKPFFRKNRILLERACSHSSSLKPKNIIFEKTEEEREIENACVVSTKPQFESQQPKALLKQVVALSHVKRPRAWSDSTYRAHPQVASSRSSKHSFKASPKNNLTRFQSRNRASAKDIAKKANSN